MKKLLTLFALISFLSANAQQGIISTIAGTGVPSFGGDGGFATGASFNYPEGIAFDKYDNLYVADQMNHRVRKITPGGMISTVAGNGVGGFSGDGGTAVSACLNRPVSVTIDDTGNLYIADIFNCRVRKVSTSGIITTFAGNGVNSYSGDGGPATAAALKGVYCTAIDRFGNVYISCSERIRKVSPAGIISHVAGTDGAGYSGDGGPATSAKFGGSLVDMCFDKFGNLYIVDEQNDCIRKINTAGIVTTVAGTGTGGFSGDGGPAVSAQLNGPQGVFVDTLGNMYIPDGLNRRLRKVNASGIINTIAGTGAFGSFGDGGLATDAVITNAGCIRPDRKGNLYFGESNSGHRIRKIVPTTPIFSESFSVYVTNYCGGVQFNLMANIYSAGQHVKTYVNGTVTDTTTSLSSTYGTAVFFRHLARSGQYTIKHVLLNGSSPIDSVVYSHNYISCQNVGLNFYSDENSNCRKDSGEHLTTFPLLVKVDSNGITVDTISATSGLYYTAYGDLTDVYTFRIIPEPAGVIVTCPTSATIVDTLSSSFGMSKDIGFSCGSATLYNLGEYGSSIAGRHMQSLNFMANNTFCAPLAATLTMRFSPKYIFESATPIPISVAGNEITWNLSDLSSSNASPQLVHATVRVPGAWLVAGDTVHTSVIISPTSGDVDTLNNHTIRIDTVKGSWDPNDMDVKPGGNILPGTNLQYTISFENTGNDTAFNIYIMDTLSDNVDPHSLRIVAATAKMNISKYYDTSIHHNIVRFDFPDINLLDSSYHDLCHGFVVFNIKAKNGLADGTAIFNHAGIFFDYNPVVMTDTVENTVRLISGPGSVCIGSTITLTEAVLGGTWSCSNGHATIVGGIVNGVSTGVDTITYTVTNDLGTTYTTKVVTINPLPNAGSIVGVSSLCAVATVTLTDLVTGGAWSSGAATIATVSSTGIVTGISSGTVSISYAVSDVCGTAMATKVMTVNPLPLAGSISGPSSLCTSTIATLSTTGIGGTWTSGSPGTATVSSGGAVTGVSVGTSAISYIVTNGCGTSVATQIISVNPLPNAGVISGIDSVCVGSVTTLISTGSAGSWSSSATGIALISSAGLVTGVSAGTTSISYSVSNSCGIDVATATVTVNPMPYAGVISGSGILCESSTTTLSSSITGGTWSVASSGIAGISAGVLFGVTAGNTFVSYSVANSCGFDVAIIPVTVETSPNPGVISGPSTVCIGQTITFSSTGTTTGIWNSVNGYITISAGIVTGLAVGLDSVLYSVTNSCGTSTATTNVTITDPCPLQIENYKPGTNFEVYPNPAADILTIKSINVSFERFTIINNIGQTVINQSIIGNTVHIDIKALPPGIYLIKLAGEKNATAKFIKM
jgi:uncharacterized repeat protein (TIGR01451 family)